MKGRVHFGSTVIPYEIIASKRRKTSQIFVEKNKVQVRVPYAKTNSQIKAMVEGKKQWIFKKQLELKHRKQKKSQSYKNGSRVPYFGKLYKLEIILGTKDQIKSKKDTLVISLKSKKNTTRTIKKLYENWMICKSQKILQKRLAKFAKKLGVKPRKLVIKDLKTRWGSSTEQGIVTLNLHLLKAPKEIVEYIVLHELVHFKIKNHPPEFWGTVEQIIPNYNDNINWLEKNGTNILEFKN